jgi:hypothetical protein
MEAVEFRVWSPYAAQARNHWERAARFRRYADEAPSPRHRDVYLRVVEAEKNLATTAERLSKQFQMGAEGLDPAPTGPEESPLSHK